VQKICSKIYFPKGSPYAWCATAVDSNGVMLPQKSGVCDDERNVAYDGPGKFMEKQYTASSNRIE